MSYFASVGIASRIESGVGSARFTWNICMGRSLASPHLDYDQLHEALMGLLSQIEAGDNASRAGERFDILERFGYELFPKTINPSNVVAIADG